MSGTVVLLPDMHESGWSARRDVAADLAAHAIPIFIPVQPAELDDAASARELTANWVAHIAVDLTRARPEMPLLLVAHGESGSRVQALGFSQRASRHAIAGYVFIDAELPVPAGSDWPDAPVDVITTVDASPAATKTARIAALRGWTCHLGADPADVIRDLMHG